MRKPLIVVLLGLAFVGSFGVNRAPAQAVSGSVTTLAVPAGGGQVDFVNATPMPLPQGFAESDQLRSLLSTVNLGVPGSSAGGQGNGITSAVHLGVPAASGSNDIEPQEFGTSQHPFSTATADLLTAATNTQFPYRPSGKLFFNIGNSTFVCSASLIKRGVVVTAAHCVANYGKKQFYTNWRFVPGYRNGSAPFGTWTVQTAAVLTAYFNGTDPCFQVGVVCQDDVAVLLLNNSPAGALPGTATGWYGFGVNLFGFNGQTPRLTHISQMGYPVCLDNGAYMERNDSHGYVNTTMSSNTIIGSLMCGGSSGGPWLVNFGIRPTLTGTAAGTAPNPNIVVGVTSWGYVNPAVKQQGASPFKSTNITPLVNTVCAIKPAACI